MDPADGVDGVGLVRRLVEPVSLHARKAEREAARVLGAPLHAVEGDLHDQCRPYVDDVFAARDLERIVQAQEKFWGSLPYDRYVYFNLLVGVSGGRDSIYGLHYIKTVLGLNPVAYTYDWGMVTDLARRNVSRICGKLGIEHILVSADIPQKREYIRKNVDAWLARLQAA